jgi:FkbM family methyltransferase
MTFAQKMFQTLDWRFRAELGLRARNYSELAYQINRLPVAVRPGSSFSFPWGNVEYLSVSDLRGQFSEIFVRRHYAFQSAVAEPVIIDAGGNIGMSAIWFKQEYPQSKLVVYEADPALAAVLKRNLGAAGIDGVDVRNAAVWSQDGFVSFANLGQDKGMVSSAGAIRVASVDLALHLPERVELLKLDVEGAEYGILERLCHSGAIARVRNLAAEFHVHRGDTDLVIATLGRLREAGMQVAFTSALGSWLGPADVPAAFESVGREQALMEVFAWR